MMHIDNIYKVVFDDNEVVSCYVTPMANHSNRYYVVNVDTLLGTDITITSDRIDEDNKIITLIGGWTPEALADPNLPYNYFQYSNLSAWKVWYCLDNDKNRFAWADDTYKLNPSSIICDCYQTGTKVDGPIDFSEKQFVNGTIYYRDEKNDTTIPHMGNTPAYAWTSENNITIFTLSVSPDSNATTYGYNSQERITLVVGGVRNDIHYQVTSYVEGLPNYDFPNGRGVIYRLIDEWNNDCPYDFKNIQTKLDGEDVYEYTFYIGPMGEMIGADSHTDISIPIIFEEMPLVSANNKIGYFINETIGEGYNIGQFLIPFIHLESTTCYNTIGSHASQVKLNQCSVNTIGDFAAYITLNNVRCSSFGHNCGANGKIIISNKENLNYGNNGVELATKDDIGDIETALNNI
jgi:hypothetical protein